MTAELSREMAIKAVLQGESPAREHGRSVPERNALLLTFAA